MYGYIYITINLIDGKKYIGRHKSETFDINYYGSGKVILRAIKKLGAENFKCEILCECMSEDELNQKEEYYINLYNAVESREFYNLKPGGIGKSEKGKIYINKNNKEMKIYPNELEYYLSLGYTKGRLPMSQDTIQLIRLKTTGKKRTAETKEKLRLVHLGKKASEETKEKLRKSHLGKPSNKRGKIAIYNKSLDKQLYIFDDEFYMYENDGWEKRGKPKHKDFSRLVSESKKGTIIINNGQIQKHIKPNEFENYTKIGFVKGKLPQYCKKKNI